MHHSLVGLGFAALSRLNAETAHDAAMLALRAGLAGSEETAPSDPRLSLSWLGYSYATPVGLAAGFDKGASCPAALLRLGFSAVEIGTVTLRPQPGNPKPRLFRLRQDGAVINRMGFNNPGSQIVAARLRRLAGGMPLGVNIGPNKDSEDVAGETSQVAAALAAYARWLTINVSSPNTPGLREWQAPRRLADLLRAIRAAATPKPPVLVKLSPDLDPSVLPDLIEACVDGGVAGLVVSNTTVSRPPGLRGRDAVQSGGLSGRPLMSLSTTLLAQAARLANGRLALVGAGGVASGADVLSKLRAGAGFVQLYTAFALEGPALISRLREELLRELDVQGFADVTAAIGADL